MVMLEDVEDRAEVKLLNPGRGSDVGPDKAERGSGDQRRVACLYLNNV